MPAVALATALMAVGCGRGCEGLVADGQVHDLVAAGFDAAIRSHPLAFVEFYAPWCGHCKKLVPEWDRLAALAKPLGIPVAKVDAIAEKPLAERQGVASFPTLKLFRGDPSVVKAYQGPRTADKMAEWLKVWSRAELVERPTTGAWPWGAAARKPALMGVLSGAEDGGDTEMLAVLEKASFTLNARSPGSEVPVAAAQARDDELVASGLATSTALPAVIAIRDFDFEEPIAVYPGKWQLEPLLEWFEQVRVPALIPAQESTERHFLQGPAIDTGRALVILFGGSQDLASQLHELAAKPASGKGDDLLKWVRARDDAFGEGLAKNVGLSKADFPELVLWEFGETEDDDKVFRLSDQVGGEGGPSKRGAELLVARWKAGELRAAKDPVLALTLATFEEKVLAADQDVLVEFYAPWCGFCKNFAPVYRDVALHYAQEASVRIAKLDATKHKPPNVEVKSYPTILFYPRGRKSNPVEVPSKAREKQSLIDFLEEHRTRAVPGNKKAHSAPPEAARGKAGGPTTTTTTAVRPASATPTHSLDGVWVFDDLADPSTRGTGLSPDMIGSRSGYTLVNVGQMGILIAPGGDARAVRRFQSLEEASVHVASGPGTAGSSQQPTHGRLPCPVVVDLASCQAWCENVGQLGATAAKAVLGGSSCREWNGKDPSSQPTCSCYGRSYDVLEAMCLSPCRSA